MIHIAHFSKGAEDTKIGTAVEQTGDFFITISTSAFTLGITVPPAEAIRLANEILVAVPKQ